MARREPTEMLSRTDLRNAARRQGVERPYEILLRMAPESRRIVADVLGCRIDGEQSAEEQAWRIINESLRGLQARTHSLQAQLTPFSRNHNWWEIVTRAANWLGIRWYPGLKDEEVERLVFERFAAAFVENNLSCDSDAIESLVVRNTDFDHAIRALRLSRDGTRTVWSALVLGTLRADQGLRDGVAKIGDWLCHHLRWAWPAPLSSGLRLLHQRLAGVFHAWVSRGGVEPRSRNAQRVCTALALIYFQDLVDRTLAEVETARA